MDLRNRVLVKKFFLMKNKTGILAQCSDRGPISGHDAFRNECSSKSLNLPPLIFSPSTLFWSIISQITRYLELEAKYPRPDRLIPKEHFPGATWINLKWRP